MRPAQKAPENSALPHCGGGNLQGFNEAGAKSAGKQDLNGLRGAGRYRFNEAGAKSAGKR